MLLPVVDAEGEPDELRQNRRAAAPYLDHVVTPGHARGFRFLQQVAVDEGPFPDRTRHTINPTAASSCGRGGSPRSAASFACSCGSSCLWLGSPTAWTIACRRWCARRAGDRPGSC